MQVRKQNADSRKHHHGVDGLEVVNAVLEPSVPLVGLKSTFKDKLN